MFNSRRRLGDLGERIACDFLKKKGYKILAKNYRIKRGEIDIVAEKGSAIVFVEVKTRKKRNHGEPKEAVNMLKKKRLINAACFYLTRNNLWHRPIRFDVIGIIIEDKRITLDHDKDVFSLDHTLDSGNTYWQPW